ncbi:MAG TPA: zinc-dependent metalloprotease [Candidatus Nanopelagicaceae bacterium]|nr:zinc-dependent metalloprotease [Candidatus Nanopelagicaceae bacterium]
MSEGFGFNGDLGAFFSQLGKVFSGGALPADAVRDIARAAVSASGDRSLSENEIIANSSALRLADLWLDETTSMPAAGGKVTAWSRAEWVEQTLDGWLELIGPLAENLGNTMSAAFKKLEDGGQLPAELNLGDLSDPAGLGGFAGPLGAIVKQLGGALFAQQLGTTIGALAGKVVGGNDITLPLTNVQALIPANVAEWGAGLNLNDEDVRIFLALRESATARLFAHVPWLAPTLRETVSAYGSGLIINIEAIQEQAERTIAAMGQSDDPQALQEAIDSGLFSPAHTPAQEAALTRLETLLALIEGWVDDVVGQAMGERIPSRLNLQETSRRRRATASPTQITFATLIGLEVSPRLAREAANFWRAATDEYGIEKRDELWSHSELLPDTKGIEDPTSFFRAFDVPDDLSGLTDS